MAGVMIGAVALAAAILFLLVVLRGSAIRTESGARLREQIVPVDVEALAQLVDRRNEEFARTWLSARDFRKSQRLRARAAISYVQRARHNAALMLRAGEMAKNAVDPAVISSAKKTVQAAVRIRFETAVALCRLSCFMVFPTSSLSDSIRLESYRELHHLEISAAQRPVEP